MVLARPAARRPRCTVAFLAAVGLTSLACGGGTDVAPPTPVVDGLGFAQASLDGVSRGDTEVVSSVVSGSTTRRASVVGEVVQFGATPYLTAANRPMTPATAPPPLVLTGPGGPYVLGASAVDCAADPACQFWVEDYEVSALGRNATATNPIPTGVPLSLSYDWLESLQSVQVSIVYGALGEDIRVQVHNVGRNETGPFSVTAQSSAPPADGSKAFDALMRQGMLEASGQRRLQVVADPGNRVDVTGIDLSNTLDPCIQGRATVLLTDPDNADPLNRSLLDVTFDDSNC